MKLFTRKDPVTEQFVRETLQELRDALSVSLGEQLISLIVYGDYVKPGHFQAERSHVNLMLVLQKVDCPTLDQFADVVRGAERKIRLTTMVVTADDLKSSCDVFPIKFHDMQSHHGLLAGSDVMSDLEISDDHLRLRCEQELKNQMIRLGTRYLHMSGPAELWNALSDSASGLLRVLHACLTVKNGYTPEADTDVVKMFGEDFGLKIDAASRILELWDANTVPSDTEARDLFGRFMQLVREAAHAVDQMEDAA
ncbi:MAG: hypothetical protein ACI8P0_001000 [Planctomycetaceae bacterium]|jgi:hypothetical protein